MGKGARGKGMGAHGIDRLPTAPATRADRAAVAFFLMGAAAEGQFRFHQNGRCALSMHAFRACKQCSVQHACWLRLSPGCCRRLPCAGARSRFAGAQLHTAHLCYARERGDHHNHHRLT